MDFKKLRYLIIFTLFHSLAHCKNAPVNENPTTSRNSSSQPLIKENLEGATQLTFTGNNRNPKMNRDQDKVIFSSSKRAAHKLEQIYILNITDSKEDRISYNDGINLDPQFSVDEKLIFFQSTSDEQKDFPEKLFPKEYGFTKQSFWNFENPNLYLNSEIYSYMLSNNITPPQRLTQRVGFDGFIAPIDINDIVWASKTQNQFVLSTNNLKTKKSSNFFKSDNLIWKPIYSHLLKKWFWISWSQEASKSVDSNSIVYLDYSKSNENKKPETLKLPVGVYHDIAALNSSKSIDSSSANVDNKLQSSLIISAKLKSDDDYNIYMYHLETQCLFKLISHKGDEIDLNLSTSDKTKKTYVLFSHRKETGPSSSFQIYISELNVPTSPTCIQ